jgi:hypothetical protein
MRDLGARVNRLEQAMTACGAVVVWREAGETDERATERWKAEHPGRAHDLSRPGVSVWLVSWLQ